MILLHIVILALIQGITEFLPISSSGHLVLVPQLTGWTDQGLVIDVAMHVGTLLAVMLYFHKDVWGMTVGLLRAARGRPNPEARTAILIIVATLPVIVAGFLLKDYVETSGRALLVVAWATVGFGLLLWFADSIGMNLREMRHLTYSDAVIVGLAQVLALIPGTSRSGITMTAARLLGYERPEAAKFSMLLSIPTILGAGVLAGYDLYKSGNTTLELDAALAAGLAFLSALIAIALLMAWLKRSTFRPFAVYRLLLGGFLLLVGYNVIPLETIQRWLG